MTGSGFIRPGAPFVIQPKVNKYYYYYYIRSTAFYRDNLDKPAPER